MKKQRAIDAIALYKQLSTEVGSMLKQPPGIIVSKIMAMILQAPTISQHECRRWYAHHSGRRQRPRRNHSRRYVQN